MQFPPALPDALAHAREQLLAHRGPHGHWEGELSSSALSTAITVCALTAYCDSPACSPSERQNLRVLCERGLQWLVAHQNGDGGWGDTTLSFSNISTTSLCWAAFAGRDGQFDHTVSACVRWLYRAIAAAAPSPSAPDAVGPAGIESALDPAALASAIRKRYGKDHTFSVPILTTLALTGRLGPPRQAWRLVPQLPFELAAFPHAWYARLKLPVVSYALPALIAIGQVRFHHAPGWNLPFVALRRIVQARTLRVLREIQPASGGYLEASPLTSFVSLSLIGAGRAAHPVVRHGLDFLIRSVRPDGSWAIDSNLATWVTTLSIGALEASQDLDLSAEEQEHLRAWLLNQQYRVEHPYTHAAPGGWAWTDLPGGVPDADDTPGALLALHTLNDGREEIRAAAAAGSEWLLDLQNGDGGMPTFCRGWGTLPFDRSSADLTAHAIRAWLAWQAHLPPRLQQRIGPAIRLGLRFLTRVQRADGAWSPLWFGNQHLPDEENLVYGTTRVLLAAVAMADDAALAASFAAPVQAALEWLLGCQSETGGWGGGEHTPVSIEETALAVDALAAGLNSPAFLDRITDRNLLTRMHQAVSRGTASLIAQTDGGRSFPPTPIGFYFAKLWYFETLYPVVYATSAFGRTSQLITTAPTEAPQQGALR